MTDKLQKIREVIEKRYEYWKEKELNSHSIESEIRMSECQHLLLILDSLQEEPVALKVLEDMLNAKTAAASLGISQEEHDRIVDECIYGKEPELVDVDDLPNKEEEPVSEDFEEALANEWKGYIDRGAATVDALEDNTQELAFAKGFYRGAKWKEQQMMAKAGNGRVDSVSNRQTRAHITVAFDSPRDIKVLDRLKVIVIKED